MSTEAELDLITDVRLLSARIAQAINAVHDESKGGLANSESRINSVQASLAANQTAINSLKNQVLEIPTFELEQTPYTEFFKLVLDDGLVTPSLYRSASLVSGSSYRMAVIAKASELSKLNLYLPSGVLLRATFNLSSGTIDTPTASQSDIADISMTALGNGWYECSVTGVADETRSNNAQIRVLSSTGETTYTGDGSSGLYFESVSFKKDGVELWTETTGFDVSPWNNQGHSVSGVTASPNTLQSSKLLPFKGKKWAALGTSITEGAYPSALAELIGASLTNLGVSGASIAAGTHYGSLGIYNQIGNIPADSAIVTVEAGVNDFGTDNSTLGALGDMTTATFYGALYAAAAAIRAQAPDAIIAFITPYSGAAAHASHRHFRVNSKGETLSDYQVAVNEVAELLSMPCIRAGEESGIGYLTADNFTDDSLHLNDYGAAQYARYVADKIVAIENSYMIADAQV